MDHWKELKKIAEQLYKSLHFQKAAEKYITALHNLIDSNFSEARNDDSERDSSLDIKTEAAKICSNVSLMYLKLWETSKSEDSVLLSVKYAKKAIDFDPTWLKGYLRLCKAYYSQNEVDNAIDIMMTFMSFAKDEDVKLAKPQLKELQFYTNGRVIRSSPSWEILNFPDNVYVIDPDGAGHFNSLNEFIAKCGNEVTKASLLVRPGIYVGTYVFSNSNIDIVGDCDVDIDPKDRAITKDTPVVFRNCEFFRFEEHMYHTKPSGIRNLQPHTFVFEGSKIQMKRVTVEERLLEHSFHAVFGISSDIDIKQCSIRSMCSASVSTGDNVKLTVDASIFIDVFSAVMVAGKNSDGCLKNCVINKTVGSGVEVRNNAKLVTLDSRKISNTKQQGLMVYNGAKRVKITGCLFETNNIEKTVNQGAIQLNSCKAKIEGTVIKNQNAGGIVIEGGNGEFFKLTFTNCFIAILVQAGVLIKECDISHCVAGINICEVISDPVVLESNSITKCLSEVVRLATSPWPVVKGQVKPQILEIDRDDAITGCHFKSKRKARAKTASRGINIGPVGDVLGINEKHGLFEKKTSKLGCRCCGYSNPQIDGKLKTCGNCKMEVYCSKSCQKRDWKYHKPMCEFYKRVDRAYKETVNK